MQFIFSTYEQTSMSACPAMEVVLRSVQTLMEATFAHVRMAICSALTTEHAMVSSL